MNNLSASKQADEFLAQSGEFRLGSLVTEQSHPITKDLSRTAERSIFDALGLLFQVDIDVLAAYGKWISTDVPERIADTVFDTIRAGGKIFFTGCGATGRLSILLESLWREYWQRSTIPASDLPADLANRVFSVMAGGDYALIKSVEGFEDFAQFGGKQLEDMGVSQGDVVFAITEGGETSFVIGTAWKGLEKGAEVYFVYCNPDDVLKKTVTRSREILDEPKIEKVNLTTGPMAIMGSTRMQATSIQLLAMLTVMEMVIGKLAGIPTCKNFILDNLETLHSTLQSDVVRRQLAEVVGLESSVYRSGRKSTYFADHFGIDVLTDTTERSPTFCTPAFRKWDDSNASDSWSYLILPYPDSCSAWCSLLKRKPRGLAWSEKEISDLIGADKTAHQSRIMRQIGFDEILKFRIGTDGLAHRPVLAGDLAVCVIDEREIDSLLSPEGFFHKQIEAADRAGAHTALIFVGEDKSVDKIKSFLETWDIKPKPVFIPLPASTLELDIIGRIGIKMLLNALSTCIMVRLGRVKGNCMVAVVPSNLKLIDRSTRYVRTLTGLSYEDACYLLFKSIDWIRPRMQSGQSYPPPVELSLISFEYGCTQQEAEIRLNDSRAHSETESIDETDHFQ